MYVQSVDLFYKICRGTQSGSYESIEFIYPGRNNKSLNNIYLLILIILQLYIIFIGTKWCGPGNIAKNYSDLGAYREEDICCREHDHCTRTLETGQCLFNLCNTSPYTR